MQLFWYPGSFDHSEIYCQLSASRKCTEDLEDLTLIKINERPINSLNTAYLGFMSNIDLLATEQLGIASGSWNVGRQKAASRRKICQMPATSRLDFWQGADKNKGDGLTLNELESTLRRYLLILSIDSRLMCQNWHILGICDMWGRRRKMLDFITSLSITLSLTQ